MKYIKITASSISTRLQHNPGEYLSPVSACLPLQILFLNLIYDLSCLFMTVDKVDDEFVKKAKMEAQGLVGSWPIWGRSVPYTILPLLRSCSSSLPHRRWRPEPLPNRVVRCEHVHAGAGHPDVAHREDPVFPEQRGGSHAIVGAGAIAVACIVPFTAVGRALGLTALPAAFWPVLIAIVGAYLVHAQLVKWAYRRRFEGEWL